MSGAPDTVGPRGPDIGASGIGFQRYGYIVWEVP